MTITVNGAGSLQADPILAGLGIQVVAGPASMDVAQINDVFMDAVTGFPGTTTVKASLTPAASVITGGASGGYDDTTKQWNIGDTTGLSADDAMFISHANITDGIYRIGSVVNGTDVTIQGNPLNGSGNQSNVWFQVAWSWEGATDAAPINHSGAGSQNFFKFDSQDGGAVVSQTETSFWVADPPAGADYIELAGGNYSGLTVSDNLISLDVLRNWANNGGISHIELANHSVQTVNNFTWQSGGGSGEVTLATAEGGLTADAGDGTKYGRLLLKAASGSATIIGVDIEITVDTAGPAIQFRAYGT